MSDPRYGFTGELAEALHRTEAQTIELPPITCGQTMIGGPCDRVSLHEGDHENSLSRTVAEARRVFNI